MEQLASLLCKALYLFVIVLATLPHHFFNEFPSNYIRRKSNRIEALPSICPSLFRRLRNLGNGLLPSYFASGLQM
ncbi:hypothetical protein OUZ56_001524 [Daphnia magna]|uniref:Secreted protein n=1 Tax=Daphnia magna TaxID=35525 RepID=A0ABR0A3H6_9CRUS|nr:hypothetical protein OUZ56_001524 [Daphnia magna]